jgi:hypothetical protein
MTVEVDGGDVINKVGCVALPRQVEIAPGTNLLERPAGSVSLGLACENIR